MKSGNLWQGKCAFCLAQQSTSDQNILDITTGDSIEFITLPPEQSSCAPTSICKDHFHHAYEEITALLCKGVIIESNHEPGEFVSQIFSVPKNDDNGCFILNLKNLNAMNIFWDKTPDPQFTPISLRVFIVIAFSLLCLRFISCLSGCLA